MAPPPPPAGWRGVRDATQFGPSCPQTASPFAPPGTISEDCLYLNVYAPTVGNNDQGGRPVLVWIHGGGLVQDGARNYDGTKLAADGAVVVTINYRLGALGFLAHPALASRPGGPAGNYGLMDQQAALRWVQRNIARFGGDPHNVTIAGESAGGLSVLAQMVSSGARGLFQRAIVQSGTFALNQRPLATAEAAGQTFATAVGCPDQSAACLRSVPVSDLVSNFGVEIPGVVDGAVLTQPIGTALTRGQFARVPVINGITHDEELLFVAGLGITVSQGTNIPLAAPLSDSANYQPDIAQALGVSAARAAAIANEYPLSAYPSAVVAFSLLVSDASFACPALQVDRQTAARGVPTYAYQFNDDNAPVSFLGLAWAWRRTGQNFRICSTCRTRRSCSTPTSRRSPPACGPTGPVSPGPATRRRAHCPGRRSTELGCCRSCRCSRRSRPTSPPGTTAHSGPPGNDTPAAAHPSGCRADERGSRKG